MSASAAPAPSFPCPYTVTGCPLFNQIELPKPTTPSCSGGGCSPAPVAPSALLSSSSNLNDSLKLPPIGSRPLSPGRLPSLDFASSFAPPKPPLTNAASNEWQGYLDFGLQPSEVDLAPLYVPFPQAQPQQSTSKRSGSGSIWDIEELVSPYPTAKKPRVSSQTASPELPDLPTAAQQQQSMASGLSLPVDESRASPASSEGGNEVITPFISKLSYLLDHQEYQPWIRWDTSGNYILIAHTKPHLLEILARYFRHTTIASFVRQLNIYGFKRVTTGSLLSILESVSLPNSVLPPNSSTPETFSASDYSAFHSEKFFMSVPGGRQCKLGGLKPITKERGPRNRSKKAKEQAAAEKKRREEQEDKGTSPELE
ncbi:hypothetical protein JCM5353_005180 [Sporobolomyces roseus]